MATIFLRRRCETLVPVPDGGDEHIFPRTWREGDLLRCDVKKSRSIGLHRKAFVLLNVLQKHVDYPSLEALRTAMTIGAGYVEPHINPMTGETCLVPRSWAFDKMDETEMRALYNAMIGVALHMVAGSSRGDWEASVDEIARL